jgi:hypothetical protein
MSKTPSQHEQSQRKRGPLRGHGCPSLGHEVFSGYRKTTFALNGAGAAWRLVSQI